MGVRKFRSVEDMPAARALTPLKAENLRVACELSELALALHGRRLSSGVRKYKSIDDAEPGWSGPEDLQPARR